MKIKRLYIGDFGIIRNQTMKNISPSINVIGGFNRAGKSTLLEVLRHIGYGFTNNKNLPPSNLKYFVECDLQAQKENCVVKLIGYGRPEFTCSSSEDINLDKIFGIDYFTYKNIFTISLDELVNYSENDKELQLILLGAGYNEFAAVPCILSQLQNEAEKIGGKLGNPSTKLFKIHNDVISKGQELILKAHSDVAKYIEAKQSLEETNLNISTASRKLDKLESNKIILDVLKSSFLDLIIIRDIDEYLKLDSVKQVLNEFKMILSIEKANNLRVSFLECTDRIIDKSLEFKKNVCSNLNIKDRLISERKTIEVAFNSLSGLEEKKNTLVNLKNDFDIEKRDIILSMNSLNENLNGNIDEILSINCDNLKLDSIFRTVQLYKTISEEQKDIKNEIKALVFQKNSIVVTGGNSGYNTNINKAFKVTAIISCVVLVILLVSYLIPQHESTGILLIITFITIVMGLLLYLLLVSVKKPLSMNGNELQIKKLDYIIKAKTDELSKLEIKMDGAEALIDNFRDLLKINSDISSDGVLEYFKNIQVLKGRINRLNDLGIKEKKYVSSINVEVEKLSKLVLEFDGVDFIKSEKNGKDEINAILKLSESIKYAEELDSAQKSLENVKFNINKLLNRDTDKYEIILNSYLNKAKNYIEIDNKMEKKKEIENRIALLLKTVRIKKAVLTAHIDMVRSVDNIKDIDINIKKHFYTYFNKYDSCDEVEKEYAQVTSQCVSIKEDLEYMKNTRQSLSDRLDKIMNSDDVYEAQKIIEEGKEGLKCLAERYAVLNTASYLLKSVQKDFLEGEKNTLFKDAGNILNKITNSQYKAILPIDDLSEMDYKTVLSDGTKFETTKVLSRATKEQLFLSVRMSRIKEIEYKLPVIFDDSFVNFDISHLNSTIDVLIELSKINQIFILTCHPYLIDNINKKISNISFYKIEKGEIAPTTSKELSDYLWSEEEESQ